MINCSLVGDTIREVLTNDDVSLLAQMREVLLIALELISRGPRPSAYRSTKKTPKLRQPHTCFLASDY